MAQESAEIRKERLRGPRRLNAEVRRRIEKLMREEDWSPEQMEGWCRRKGYRMVSKSSIYEYIRKDRDSGGDLYKHCRFKLKHRKRPVGKYMPIKNRVGIEERPREADGTRFGDWEMDLIVGAGEGVRVFALGGGEDALPVPGTRGGGGLHEGQYEARQALQYAAKSLHAG